MWQPIRSIFRQTLALERCVTLRPKFWTTRLTRTSSKRTAVPTFTPSVSSSGKLLIAVTSQVGLPLTAVCGVLGISRISQFFSLIRCRNWRWNQGSILFIALNVVIRLFLHSVFLSSSLSLTFFMLFSLTNIFNLILLTFILQILTKARYCRQYSLFMLKCSQSHLTEWPLLNVLSFSVQKWIISNQRLTD